MYNALLAACDRAGQYDRALELYREMQGEGVAPNAVTHQVGVGGWARLAALRAACVGYRYLDCD